MKKTTIKELRQICKELGIKVVKDDPNREDTMTPELRAAISDTKGYERYLRENYPEIIDSKNKEK